MRVEISNNISRESSIKRGTYNMPESRAMVHNVMVNINKEERRTRDGDLQSLGGRRRNGMVN